MKMQAIREMAKKMNIKTDGMKKAALIRAIQRAEGNSDCFGRGKEQCAEDKCLWREDCL